MEWNCSNVRSLTAEAVFSFIRLKFVHVSMREDCPIPEWEREVDTIKEFANADNEGWITMIANVVSSLLQFYSMESVGGSVLRIADNSLVVNPTLLPPLFNLFKRGDNDARSEGI